MAVNVNERLVRLSRRAVHSTTTASGGDLVIVFTERAETSL